MEDGERATRKLLDREGNREGVGGGKGEEKGMYSGESDGVSDELGGTERNDCADLNEGDSAIETAVTEAYFQTSKIKYKTEGDEGPFLAQKKLHSCNFYFASCSVSFNGAMICSFPSASIIILI